MTSLLNLHSIAAIAFERMLYCLAEGTALAAVMSVVLRMVPRKNSQTRFVAWFATLSAVVLLPLLEMGIGWGTGGNWLSSLRSFAPHALLTIPASWAVAMLLAWAALAGMGLMRVAAGLWQIRRLRAGCTELDPQRLAPELRALVAEFRKARPVSILVSSTLEVPTAIGFQRPAIVIPEWLAHENKDNKDSKDNNAGDRKTSAELGYVLMHEMAHLRRRDDWTNLAQKLVKAVLFFHPGVWWIERELSLDREMACDDAVLAQAASPRAYAQCLARVAEKGFLRRQIALAQAAVDRMKQLSARVARILDSEGDRPRSTRLWKPAIPLVAVIAVVCAVSTSGAPDLVRLSDGPDGRDGSRQSVIMAASAPAAAASHQPIVKSGRADRVMNNDPLASEGLPRIIPAAVNTQSRVQAWPASLRSSRGQNASLPAGCVPSKKHPQQKSTAVVKAEITEPHGPAQDALSTLLSARLPSMATQATESQGVESAENGRSAGNNDVAAQPAGMVILVLARGQMTSVDAYGSVTWQLNTWELHLVVPAKRATKPVPRKT